MKNIQNLTILILLVSTVLISCKKNKLIEKTRVKAAFIADQEFEQQVLQRDGLVVVDFWAAWCGPCRNMDPVIEDFANEYKDVKFVKIDTDKNKQIKDRYSIYGLPTIMFFKDGKEISRQVGMTTDGTLRNKIERWR